ncbi:TPA: transposase [Pseudomonas aeruginosa]|nr:transposase [Pseudomonas aeruginosa]HCF6119513.1 transposase [Pseudomonas aeruginosa]
MDNSQPKVGAQYQIDGATLEIFHVDEELVMLRHLIHQSTVHYRRDLFITDVHKKNIIEVASPPGSGSKAMAFLNPGDPDVIEANRKLEYIIPSSEAFGGMLPVKPTEQLLQQICTKIGDDHPPSYNSVYKWMKKYRDNNCDRFSLLKSQSRLPRGKKLQEEVVAIIDQCIKDYYLNADCVTQKRIFAYIDAQIILINRNRTGYSNQLLTRPSISTVRRRIEKLCRYVVDVTRHGTTYANKKHHFSRIRPVQKEVLFLAEIDSHRLDTEVVDNEGNVLKNIAWLVVIIEIKTRMVIGWELSLTPPCAEKSIRALKRALRVVPGEEYRRGKMLYLESDNGTEFLSAWFMSFIDKLGILEGFTPTKAPNARAIIERFFKTLESWLHEQPGSTVSGTSEDDQKHKKKPCFTIEKLQYYFDLWLEKVYHATVHGSLNKPPMVAWEQEMKNKLPPQKFTDDTLDKLSRKVIRRKITHGRVHFLNLSWTGPTLPEINARLHGRTAICYYDPSDLGTVWVAHPDTPREPVRAYATRPGYQNGLTETEHEVLQFIKKEELKQYDFANPHLALLQLRQEIDKDFQLSQLLNRSKAKAKAKATPQSESKNKIVSTAKPQQKSKTLRRPTSSAPASEQSLLELPMDHLK